MAEGQLTVYWARQFEPLIGKPLVHAQLPGPWAEQASSLVGLAVVRFETRGKHMLLHLSDGRVLHCHALMFGSWQIGPRGMVLRKPERQVRVRLATEYHEAVFFSGPVVELLQPAELQTHPRLRELGPDLLSPAFDHEEAWRRLQRHPDRPLGDAILDQTIVAGIGNIYKAEALFLTGIDPRRPASSLTRQDADRLWDTAADLMWQGVADGGRTRTLPEHLRARGERNWVYQRNGRPCFRCEEKVQAIPQGAHKRLTYFCPACQR